MENTKIREEELFDTFKHYDITDEIKDVEYLVENTEGEVYLAIYLPHYKAFNSPTFGGAKLIYLDDVVRITKLEDVLPLLKEFKRSNN